MSEDVILRQFIKKVCQQIIISCFYLVRTAVSVSCMGSKLGRTSETVNKDRKIRNRGNTYRNEVKITFSLGKRCYGMGLIQTKLEESTLTSIALSVFVMNLKLRTLI